MAISGDFFLHKVVQMRVVEVKGGDGVRDEFSEDGIFRGRE